MDALRTLSNLFAGHSGPFSTAANHLPAVLPSVATRHQPRRLQDRSHYMPAIEDRKHAR